MKSLISFATVLCITSSVAFSATTMSAPKKTADTQMKTSDADVAVTRKIRDRITDMDGMSTRAQNITIVTEGQNVTLKGEVDKQEEIQKIMNVAKEEASGKNITNQLSVHK